MCLPYLVFGSVIWAAYHQFGEQSLLDQAPLVVADQTPLKLNPGPHLRDRAAAEKVGPPEHRLQSAGRRIPTEPPGEAGRAALAALQFRLGASDGGATAPLGRDSIAVVPAAAPAETTPATPAEVAVPAPGSMPAKPSFKPLEGLQAASAELAPPDERTVAARLDLRSAPAPRPALKPAVSLPRERSEWRPEPDAAPATRAVAATDQSLPEALRAWWSNLKILLASGPASSAMRAGGDDSDRQAPRGGIGNGDGGSGAGTTNGGGSARGGGSGGVAGDIGRGIGGTIGDIAGGLGRGIADSVGGGSRASRGDGDRGRDASAGGRGGRDGDRGGRGGDRGGRGGDGGRGDRGDD
jgi:hypothetical protein